jgi:hypothetical protein
MARLTYEDRKRYLSLDGMTGPGFLGNESPLLIEGETWNF